MIHLKISPITKKGNFHYTKAAVIMKQIENKEALQILLHGGPNYIIAADSLNYLIEDEEPLECYMDSKCITFINSTKDVTYITIVPISDTLEIGALVDLIKNRANPNVLVDIHSLSEDCTATLDSAFNTFLNYKQTLEDYINLSDHFPEHDTDDVRMLGSSDKDLFVSMNAQTEKYRPTLKVLFDVFVTKQRGHILGAFEHDQIIGYLSFNEILPDVFDLDYIYVVPEKRNIGIGRKLGQAYSRYAHENNHIAYWSNAKNEGSKKTALSCGFELIRQARNYVKG